MLANSFNSPIHKVSFYSGKKPDFSSSRRLEYIKFNKDNVNSHNFVGMKFLHGFVTKDISWVHKFVDCPSMQK
jgi:hypothetical protein